MVLVNLGMRGAGHTFNWCRILLAILTARFPRKRVTVCSAARHQLVKPESLHRAA